MFLPKRPTHIAPHTAPRTAGRHSLGRFLTSGLLALLCGLFVFVPVPLASAAASLPTLSVSPSSGVPGALLTVSGANFPKNAQVTLAWDGTTAEVTSVTARSTGTFGVSVRIPTLSAGSYTIRASTRNVSGTATVLVLAPTAPAPTATATPSATATVAATPTTTTSTSSSLTVVAPTPTSGQKHFGVNVAAAEFGEFSLPGTMGVDYTYAADAARQTYFASKGQTLVRVPFRWERVQRTALGPLAAEDVAGLRAMLDAAHAAGQQVILDLHNYGRYYDVPLTRSDANKLADVWAKLAQTFRGHPALYGYELMNEPHNLPEGSDSWAYLAQAATDAIRKHDTTAWILVPGYSWQSARFWPENNPTLDVKDPAGKLLYAAHLYFDANYTGTYTNSYDADHTSAQIGVDRLQPFLTWLESRNARGILTEYGVPDNDPRWNIVLDNFMSLLQSHARIAGGTYWAAGPWWGSYSLSVEPRNGQDRPQMAVLAKYQTTR